MSLHWCAWEMNLDGSALRKITCGAAGVRQPIYQTTIYTLTGTGVEPWVQIAFVGENPGERNEAGVAPNTSLWSCKTDGTALRRLTFNLSNDTDPVLLPDGRMVYAGWLRHPTTQRPEGRVALLGVNQDGTDYQTYAGDQGLRVKEAPVTTASGLVVFVEADEVAGDGSGRLASVSQARPLHTYRPIKGRWAKMQAGILGVGRNLRAAARDALKPATAPAETSRLAEQMGVQLPVTVNQYTQGMSEEQRILNHILSQQGMDEKDLDKYRNEYGDEGSDFNVDMSQIEEIPLGDPAQNTGPAPAKKINPMDIIQKVAAANGNLEVLSPEEQALFQGNRGSKGSAYDEMKSLYTGNGKRYFVDY